MNADKLETIAASTRAPDTSGASLRRRSRLRIARRLRRWAPVCALAVGLSAACKKNDAVETVVPDTPAPAPSSTPTTTAEATREYPDPPPAGPAKPIDFPDAETFRLSNGLTVYLVQNQEVPIVRALLVVRAGEMDSEFVAEFTASMLAEGTKTRSKAKIDEAIEFVGGVLGASAGIHASFVHSQVLDKDLKLALTLMADEVMNPAFPEEALAKIKQQAKTALGFAKSNPGQLASVLFDEVAYPKGHPYGRPFPTPEKIDAVTVEDLQKFHDTFFRANNAFLVLTGDISKAEAEPIVKRAFGKWKPINKNALPENPLNKYKDYTLPKELTIHLVDRPASAQSELVIGNLALARNHPDWEKMLVANAILGDDANGRLFRDVREEKGLTYGIYSRLSEGQAPGTFYITTRTRSDTTGQLLAAVFGHIKRMRNEEPSAEEVDRAVQKLIGQVPLQLETADQIASKVREALIYNLPPDYWDGYRDRLASVTPADVKDVARKYIHPIPHVVIVGDAKAVEPQIRQVLPDAKIVKYNTELEKL